MKDLSIIVIGAGIGGLSAGISLREAGFRVRIFERAAVALPLGAGVCMWPNGAKALNALGLGQILADITPELTAVQYREANGNVLCEIPLGPLIEAVGQRPYPVSRPDLHAALLARFGTQDVTFGAECVGVEQDEEGVVASFADGSHKRADLLVGADGIRSVVRLSVVGAVSLRYAYVTWVGTTPTDTKLNPKDIFTMYVGERKRVGLQPISGDRLYFFFEAPIDHCPENADVNELRSLFKNWTTTIHHLIDRLPTAPNCLAVHDLDPLGRFVNGRVILLGDAAHASTPTLGQGGAQAVEDAFVLARHLKTSTTLEGALDRYDTERRTRTAAIVLAARARSRVVLGKDNSETESWYERLRGGHRDFVEALEKITLEGPLG
jgi:FAD-dependent urate hydroxylase